MLKREILQKNGLVKNLVSSKKGFSLAEVMITLAIIGVVAAITIPTLLANYQKHSTVVKLKKEYAILQQAVSISQTENGPLSAWDTSLEGKQFFNKYFSDYLKYVNEYSGSELARIAKRKLLNDQDYYGTTYTSNNSYHVTLADGATLSMNRGTADGIWVGIDVNGITPPNKIGKDTFLFFISNEYGLQPFGSHDRPSGWAYGNYSRSYVMGTSNGNACNKTQNGNWCAALIINDGWEIASDYPW